MHVLLTRPVASSLATAKLLTDRKIITSIQPLFSIIELQAGIPPLENYQALVFTSQHSVNAFAEIHAEREMPVYCVGDSTAKLAQHHNFGHVVSADGDAVDLIKLIVETLDPKKGPLLRLAGYDGQDELLDALQDNGFESDKIQLYYIEEIDALLPKTKTLLSSHLLDGVLFFSPKTASRFYRLLAKEGLSATCRTMTAWCISKNTADALGDLPFKQVEIAARPTQDEILKLISPN